MPCEGLAPSTTGSSAGGPPPAIAAAMGEVGVKRFSARSGSTPQAYQIAASDTFITRTLGLVHGRISVAEEGCAIPSVLRVNRNAYTAVDIQFFISNTEGAGYVFDDPINHRQ